MGIVQRQRGLIFTLQDEDPTMNTRTRQTSRTEEQTNKASPATRHGTPQPRQGPTREGGTGCCEEALLGRPHSSRDKSVQRGTPTQKSEPHKSQSSRVLM